MCGIAGLLLNDPTARASPSRLHAMVEALTHRGPDDFGFHFDRSVGFGVRRLAIVDVAGGHQPISNEDGTVWVAYNGECYNFAELAAELTAAGHRFSTHSDTEVLVHGYEQWGIHELVTRLNGIFAACVWDSARQVAYLVRDRLGVKPLYYIARAPGLAFSSEIRSLIRSGFCLPKLDDEAVWASLLYQFPPTERTPLSGVFRVPAGHLIEWRPGTPMRVQRWWDFPDSGPRTDVSFDEAARHVHDLLVDTVDRQMIGDVPMGCFLSGGLDSSAVASLMACRSRTPLRTYSIAFPHSPEHDETRHAQEVARAIGADHTSVPCTDALLLDRLDEYLGDVDEPIGDAAMFPTYVLAATAARDVKVVLTGEGADEVFGGYPYYQRFLHGSAPTDGQSFDRSVGDLAPGIPVPRPGIPSPHSGFPYIAQPAFLWCLLDQDRRPSFETFRRVLAEVEERHLPSLSARTALQRAMCLDTKIWLSHNLMTKLDKATMAHGLEGRVPMLDHRLVEYAFTLPDEFKVTPSEDKRVLRAAMRSVVPAATLARKKQGFGVPLDAWFRTSLREVVQVALRDSVLVEEAVVTPQGMEAVLAAHCQHGIPLGRLIWSLMSLDRWWRETRTAIAASLPEDGAVPVASERREHTADLVIPVHGALNLVRDCLRSIGSWTGRPFRAFIVHDGGSDDEHERLRAMVAGDSRFVLVRNERNLGYTQSVIHGMRLCTADYIVLLNSDTVVTPTWLDRIVRCAESDPRIAIVNPLTNESGNTSIRMAPGLTILTMARRLASLSRRDYPDITTGVGMCMLIRRAALEWLGGVDAIFDGAYCEESDLCMRFTESGLRVVAADDAFIYHKGMGSYSESTKNALYDRNRAIFDERWSVAYEVDAGAYNRNDPLQYLRAALLRNTVRPTDDVETVRQIETAGGRLDTRRAFAAIGHGVRARVAATVLGARAAAASSETLTEWGVAQHRHPPTRFDERTIAHPTGPYIDGLPPPDAGGLRITFLISSFPLCGGIISISQLARAFIAAGHDVKFVTESPFNVPEMLNLWAQPLVYRDRAQLIDQFPESDIVIATFWTTAHEYLAELRRRYDVVGVYFIQDYEAWFYSDAEYEMQRDVVRSYAAADHHIVKSRWLAGLVARHGTTSHLVPLGLDLDVFYPRPQATGGRPRVISFASPAPGQGRRGFPETVEIFRRVHAQCPDVELVFVGGGHEMPALPFPFTHVGEAYDQNRIAALISSVDVLVDASLWQGFGRPGLEAMACGTVPVLTNIGGLVEYARHEQNCLIVDPQDAATSAAAVLRILGDRDLHARLRAHGITTASRFSHELEAARHLALYRRWMSEKSAHGQRPDPPWPGAADATPLRSPRQTA